MVAHSTFVVRRNFFSKVILCDEGIVTLLNDDKRMKVEGSGQVVVEIHDGVKRNLEDVRYVPTYERKIISLGRLEAKGCSIKASGGTLKVIRGSMVLMRGRRIELVVVA